ncbi:MAG: DUF2231 domain-containing protein [Hymenobacter sp.]
MPDVVAMHYATAPWHSEALHAVTISPDHSVSALHPLHVLLGAYPIAFFSGAFLTDIIYSNTAVMMWANFSVWLITGGLVMGIAAAIVGIGEALFSRHKSSLAAGLASLRRKRARSWTFVMERVCS